MVTRYDDQYCLARITITVLAPKTWTDEHSNEVLEAVELQLEMGSAAVCERVNDLDPELRAVVES
jgi:hypothetical protein